MKKPSTGSRPRPAADVVPEKIAPKKFKPIPEDAPARQLGEYLRAMVRGSEITLDQIASEGGLAKNTLTTTMDGRSKEWPSAVERVGDRGDDLLGAGRLTKLVVSNGGALAA